MSSPFDNGTSKLLVQPLLTPEDLARVLGFTVSTVYNFASPGREHLEKLPIAMRLGKVLRWHPAVVQQWLDEKACLTEQDKSNEGNSAAAMPPVKRKRGRPTNVSRGLSGRSGNRPL